MLKIVFALTVVSLAFGAQIAEAKCANQSERFQIARLNTQLLRMEKKLAKEKSKCDKLETKGLAACEKKCSRNVNCTVMQCKAEAKWYPGGRVGCYVDKNKDLEPQIAAIKEKMKPLLDKDCMPLDKGAAYKRPSSIDLNAKNGG